MAKQLGVFSEDLKKLDTKYSKLNEKERFGASHRLKQAWAMCSSGEANLRSELVKARKEGASGSKPADFAKHKDVAEAMQLMGVGAKELDQKLADMDAFAKACEEAITAYKTVGAKIEKDLKSRKDSSETKNDIVALHAAIDQRVQELQKLVKTNQPMIYPAMRGYSAKLTATIAKVIAEAPDVQRAEVDRKEEPEALKDRVRKRALSQCSAGLKAVQTACDAAIEKAGAGDKGGAAAQIKAASTQLLAVQKVSDQYQQLVAKYDKGFLDGSKDRDVVLADVKKMAQCAEAAARLVRGVATTIKKAG